MQDKRTGDRFGCRLRTGMRRVQKFRLDRTYYTCQLQIHRPGGILPCSKLSAVDKLDNVEYIGDYAFYDPTSVNNNGVLKLPKCTYIGQCAFGHNYNSSTDAAKFINIDAPKCTYIGKYAFSAEHNASYTHCKFRQIYIPECLSVGFRAFTDIDDATKCVITLWTDNSETLRCKR